MTRNCQDVLNMVEITCRSLDCIQSSVLKTKNNPFDDLIIAINRPKVEEFLIYSVYISILQYHYFGSFCCVQFKYYLKNSFSSNILVALN